MNNETTKLAPAPKAFRLRKSLFVRANCKVSANSVFSDVDWNMSSHVSVPGVSNYQKRWNFSVCGEAPDGFSLALAEYAYARMFRPVETIDRDAEWLTVHNELTALNGLVNFCRDQAIENFLQVNREICERYLEQLQFGGDQSEPKSPDRVSQIILVINRLWEFRSAITEPFSEAPFGKSLRHRLGTRRRANGENRTPVIPEKIFVAMTSAALDYVLTDGNRIVAVWQRMQVEWDNVISTQDKPLAGRLSTLQRFTKKLLLEYPSTWRLKEWQSYGDVYEELHRLRTACIVVILAFSGVRPSELLSIRAACCVIDSAPDGHIMHYLNTELHKHKKGGVRDAWVVIDEVVKAVEILEVLTKRIRDATGDQRLIISDGSSSPFSVQKSFKGVSISELQGASIIYQLNAFWNTCVHKLKRSQSQNRMYKDNLVEPWHFNVRQFRRTLARFIARQPFGVIAGMLQYKHLAVTVFEGYAGAEPEWNKLQDEEKILASVDILEEIAIDLSKGEISGDQGKQLQEEIFVEFRGRAEDFPPSQIAKWLASSKKALFVGKFNFCFFEPGKALCTADILEKGRPVLNSCQPAHCSNSCVSKRHESMWRSQLCQAEELVLLPTTSKFQKIFLLEEIAVLKAVVEEIEDK